MIGGAVPFLKNRLAGNKLPKTVTDWVCGWVGSSFVLF